MTVNPPVLASAHPAHMFEAAPFPGTTTAVVVEPTRTRDFSRPTAVVVPGKGAASNMCAGCAEASTGGLTVISLTRRCEKQTARVHDSGLLATLQVKACAALLSEGLTAVTKPARTKTSRPIHSFGRRRIRSPRCCVRNFIAKQRRREYRKDARSFAKKGRRETRVHSFGPGNDYGATHRRNRKLRRRVRHKSALSFVRKRIRPHDRVRSFVRQRQQ